jgi:hypothetical protein
METAPEGFSLDIEASRQAEASQAGIEQRDAVPELEVPDHELDKAGEDGTALDQDDEA